MRATTRTISLAISALIAGATCSCDDADPVSATKGAVSSGREAAADLQMDQVAKLVQMFALDVGRVPTQEEGLRALHDSSVIRSAVERDNWKGPYGSASDLKDRFGNALGYRVTDREFVIIAYGQDGEPGGGSINADFELARPK